MSAHYYKTRPPQLSIKRDIDGMVEIKPQEHTFRWKVQADDMAKDINSGLEIRYTLDGSTPTKDSELYSEPFLVTSGEVKAIAFNNEEIGSEASNLFGVIKKDWILMDMDSEQKGFSGVNAFDENAATYWLSNPKGNSHYLSIDLSQKYMLKGFTYTPQTENSEGMIEKGIVKVSQDGKLWRVLEEFEFGNLINDPTPRRHYFNNPVETRYIMIESKVIAGGGNLAAIAELDFLLE